MRFGLWIVVLAAAMVLPLAWLAWLPAKLNEGLEALRVGWIAMSLVPLATWLLLATTPRDAIKVSPRLGKRLVLLAMLVPAAGWLVFATPTLSPGVLRHATDGAIWLAGASPLVVPPVEASSDSLGPSVAPLASAVPDADLPSLQPPLVQMVSVMAAAVDLVLPGATTTKQADWRDTFLSMPWLHRLLAWRVLLTIAILGATWELLAWLRQRDVSVWYAGLFAWSPAVLLAATTFGIGGVLATWFFAGSLRRLEAGRSRRGGFWFALALASAPMLLLALPWITLRTPASTRRVSITFLIVSMILWLPTLLPLGAAASYFVTVAHMLSHPGSSPIGLWTASMPVLGWIAALVIPTLVGVIVAGRGASSRAVVYGVLVSACLLMPTLPGGAVALLLVIASVGGRGYGLSALALAGLGGMSLGPTNAVPMLTPTLWFVAAFLAGLEALAALRRTRRQPMLDSTPSATRG